MPLQFRGQLPDHLKRRALRHTEPVPQVPPAPAPEAKPAVTQATTRVPSDKKLTEPLAH